ncbi:MAG: FG-GAP-like repeat-containing protein [Pyrinomonadaceae bacterium]
MLLVLFTAFLPDAAYTQSLALDPNYLAGVTDAPTESYVSAVQPDGKILVGGAFIFANGISRKGLARLNPDGSLDTSFNASGSGLLSGSVLEIVLQPDGRILVGGSFTNYNGVAARGLMRLNADGSLDTTFNPVGTGVYGGRVTSIVIQPDGKIIVAGQGTLGYNDVANAGIFRINPDGSIDNTFVSGFPTTSNISIEQVALQSDGKIVIAMDFNSTYGGVEVSSLLRINSDATLDSSFDVGSDFQGSIYGLAIQSDGRIVIGGFFSVDNNISRIPLARVNVNGTLDMSFTPPTFSEAYAEFVSIRPDGKILAAGTFNQNTGFKATLIRLNADATQDTSLNCFADEYAYHVTTQPDGKILVTGFFSRLQTGETRVGIARYLPSGSVDSAFNASLSTHAVITTMARQNDGKLLVGGTFTRANGVGRNSLARFNSDGTLDATFSTGTGPIYGRQPYSPVDSIAVQQDGKILVGGLFGDFNNSGKKNVVRLNGDGSLDPSFTLDTNVRSFGFENAIADIAIQSDEKILISGEALYTPATAQRLIIRLNADGSLDPTFNLNPLSTGGGFRSGTAINRILIQPDGKIVGAGYYVRVPSSSVNGSLIRLNADGSRDTSFQPPTAPPGTFPSYYSDAALQPDGKIFFSIGRLGYGVFGSGIGRANANGTTDTGFGISASSSVISLAQQDDGKVVFGGTFAKVNETPRIRLARLNADGTLDTGFFSGLDSIFTSPFSGVNQVIASADGSVLVGGGFLSYNGVSKNNLLRLVPGVAATPTSTSTPRASPSPVCGELYDNGPLITHPTGGFNGSPASYVQTSLGLSALGFPASTSTVSRLADDFTVPSGGWTIDSITLFGYQTYSTPVGTFNDARLQIWNGAPGQAGSQVIFGDTVTNRFVSSAFTGIYRVTEAAPTSDLRPIMSVVANVGVTLPAGTYWIDFQLGGTGLSGPFVAPVSILGQVNKPGSNALAFSDMWYALIDPGAFPNPPQDVPFKINGQSSCGSPTPTATPTNTPTATPTGTPSGRTAFDYDGDRKSDMSVFRPSNGAWYMQQSLDGFFGTLFGLDIDKITPADFDGDGKTDIAVYRPATGIWYVLNSSNSAFSAYQFGVAEDLPTPADYDGDGKADFSVFRPSSGTWYRTNSSNGSFFGLQFGVSEDKPTVGDFEGDGKADIAVWRPSSGVWYRLNSLDGAFVAFQFGVATDLIVPADYDGDGKTDYAVYRPSSGIWYRTNSSDGAFVALAFGVSIDIPTPGDFDGDGKADICVWRPTDGTWYRLNSSNGQFVAFQFGTNGDRPTQAAFRY